MNIQQLEYLIAVDKYKHFGKAAQACFITQPTTYFKCNDSEV